MYECMKKMVFVGLHSFGKAIYCLPRLYPEVLSRPGSVCSSLGMGHLHSGVQGCCTVSSFPGYRLCILTRSSSSSSGHLL